MKIYKLQVICQLIEMPHVPEEQPSDAAVEDVLRSIDPVKRDQNEIKEMASVAREMLNEMKQRNVSPFGIAVMPVATIMQRKWYDVSVEDVAAAAALLKRFEETAEAIGRPASAPTNIVMPVQGF